MSWTTGVYWENILRQFGDVIYVGTDKRNNHLNFYEKDIVRCLSGANKEDVFIYVDSGRPYFPSNIEKLPLLTACYLIDVHIDLPIRVEMAKFFDVIFVASESHVEIFKSKGFKNVWWVPLACEPSIYKQLEMPHMYDIGFVGHVSKDMAKRKRLLSLLSQHYRVNDYNRFYTPSETSDVYNSSKIVFNCLEVPGLNMRVFEAMSCGRLLLTDVNSLTLGPKNLFQDRHHLVVYQDKRELLELADYYLLHEDERNRIAHCGSELVRSQHTYECRAKEILNIFKTVREEKDYLIAPWRNASSTIVSISRCKIYSHWHLLKNILEELLQTRNIRSYLWQCYYLIITFLKLLKKNIKDYYKISK